MFKIVFGGHLLKSYIFVNVIEICYRPLLFFNLELIQTTLIMELSVQEFSKTVHFLPLNMPKKFNDVQSFSCPSCLCILSSLRR